MRSGAPRAICCSVSLAKNTISRGFSRTGTARELQRRGPLEAEILVGMNGQVNRALEQRGVDFGGEKFLAVDLRERGFGDAITAGIDADQFDHEPGVQTLERARHRAALRPCQQ